MRSPILSHGQVGKQGYRFGAGPPGYNMAEGDRSVTLDVVKILSGWTPKLTQRLKELAMPVQDLLPQWWMNYLKNCHQDQARPHHAMTQLAHLVGQQLSSRTVLHQLTTCERNCVSYEHQCVAQNHECGAVYLSEAIAPPTFGRTSIAGTDDDVTSKVQFTQLCQSP